METVHTRRNILKTSAAGTVVGAGLIGSSSSAMAAGASFGDGVNLQPSYFCDGDQDIGWELMNQYPNIETLRIEIEPFSFGEVNTTVEDAKRWIDEATENGYTVIASYHHYPDNGASQASALQNAADFWAEHYGTLSQDSSFTINMMNEWGNHSVSASDYASAYNDAIDTVRTETTYTGPIVCDAPGWGQGTHRLADAVEEIDDDDLILSAHVYPSGHNATTGESLKPEHLDVMDETGYPCMIGEFGNYATTTGADWSAIVDHATSLGWPVIGWAWNGDGTDGGMNMADPYWGNECSGPYSESSYFDVVYDKLGSGGSNDGGNDDGGSDDGSGGGNAEPTASINAGTTDAPVGEAVSFDASASSDEDGTIERYEWTFGDGTSSSGERVDHTFGEAGEYEVTLTVTDDAGATASDAVTVVVSGEAGPQAPTNLEVAETSPSSITIQWNGVDGADHYVTYVDGSADHETPETSTTIDSLEADTDYEIAVSAVADGGTESVARTVSATTESDDGSDGNDGSDEELNAEIRASTTSASVGERIGFNAVETTDERTWVTELSWDLGDGTTASGWWNAHRYDSSGTYTVALTATDNEGVATTHEVEVTVGSGGNDDDGGNDGSDSDDGSSETGGDGGADEDGRSNGNETPPTDGLNAEIRASTTSVSAGERVSFNAAETTGTSTWITDLKWDLGDGTTASGWWNAHRYDSSGTYTVALTATDNEGTATTHEVDITVS
ncbi:PKD domain-containing protein [Natrinema halophilum]|uniref:PKD domain-containing protein n=1 Tax=Natrinema halophilum TaxID=1699371 RepID=A0A7D5GHN6_9EURY|nr:PKD domain-containing protein [Natrinema halophilum]QLG49294.1 PKD domain-containing protein [Natrinema halophilum]